MPYRLAQNPLGGVDQYDRKIREGSADRHIPCVFLMPRRIGYDKTSFRCRKIPVCDIDRDALFPLRHQSVEQKGVIDLAAAAADFAFQFKRLLLVRKEEFGVIQQMSDQGGFSVVYTSTGYKLE